MSKKRAFFWLAYCSLFFMAMAWQRIQVTKLGYTVSKADAQLKVKTARNEHFKFKLEEMKSPMNLGGLAQSRLGLTLPEPQRVVRLDDMPQKAPEPRNWIARLIPNQEAAR